jgi:hypothetical protein
MVHDWFFRQNYTWHHGYMHTADCNQHPFINYTFVDVLEHSWLLSLDSSQNEFILMSSILIVEATVLEV